VSALLLLIYLVQFFSGVTDLPQFQLCWVTQKWTYETVIWNCNVVWRKVYKRAAAHSTADAGLCWCSHSWAEAEGKQGQHQISSEVLAGEHCQPATSAFHIDRWRLRFTYLKRSLCENCLSFTCHETATAYQTFSLSKKAIYLLWSHT